jgi:hypothetical protein
MPLPSILLLFDLQAGETGLISSSSSCAAFEYDPSGRQGIGVVQPQSGIDFPLVGPPSSDIRFLLADFWFSYDDDYDYGDADTPFEFPFRIAWMYYWPGCLMNNEKPSWAGTPTHDVDLVIMDANDRIAFDSTAATIAMDKEWGGRLHVYSWETAKARVHAVLHTKWNALADDLAPPRYYERHIIPVRATLDNRVIQRQPKRVKSFSVVLTTLKKTGVDWIEGYNMSIVHDGEVVRGSRVAQSITMSAVPGAGAGIYPGCPPQPLYVTQINNVGPTDKGDFYLAAEQCYWARQPTTVISESPRRTAPTTAMLQLGNDCIPCCPCEDFVALAEYMNRERETYWQIGRKVETTRDLYHDVRNRWKDQKCCYEKRALRLSLQPQICPYLDVLGQFCHSGDECKGPLVLEFEFEQIEFEGAGMQAVGDVVPGFTKIKGLQVIAGRRSSAVIDYVMDEGWPLVRAHWQWVEPRTDVWVQFRLHFNRCGLDDQGEPFGIRCKLRGTLDGEPISAPATCIQEFVAGSSSSSSSSSSGGWIGLEVVREATLKCPIRASDMHNPTKCADSTQIFQAIGR